MQLSASVSTSGRAGPEPLDTVRAQRLNVVDSWINLGYYHTNYHAALYAARFIPRGPV